MRIHPCRLIAAALLLVSSAAVAEDSLHCTELPFVYNVFWTTDYGPAAANVVAAPDNFLPCSGPSYALCSYSGPEPLPCKVDRERGVAICECPLFDGPYQVGVDGADCDLGSGLVWSASYNINGCS